MKLGCGSTIDRGSMSNTVIGKNTYLDNQIHIAHNVKIGENTLCWSSRIAAALRLVKIYELVVKLVFQVI